MTAVTRRGPLILRRWFFAIAIVGVAVSVALLLALWAAPMAAARFRSSPSWTPIPVGIVAAAVITLLLRTLLRGGVGLIKAYVNPPRWILLLLSILGVVAVWTRFPSTIPDEVPLSVVERLSGEGWTVVKLALVAVVALMVAPHAFRRRKPIVRDVTTVDLANVDFGVVRSWLRTDREISEPAEDFFGHWQLARRMADQIAKAAGGKLGRCPTFALIGELGAGKSSVHGLVRSALADRRLLKHRVLMVRVSLWPFESPDAAIRGILLAMEAEFSKVTSTTAIANAPARYLKAIEKLDGRLGLLSEVFNSEQTPAGALAAYDRLARLIGVHAVIWIEDLERFESRTAPIRSLLHQLQEFDRLTVVLASDSLSSRVDLQKVAQFVESIPPLETSTAWPVIARFREACLSEKNAPIDPASTDARETFASSDESLSERLFGPTNGPKGALLHLVRTPRVLKHGLRAALDVWDRLKGEVDFDDVIVMCLIRASRPDVFALVDEHIEVLREGPSNNRRDDQKDDTAFEAAMRSMVEDSRTKMALDRLLELVFPRRNDASSTKPAEKPQGLAFSEPRDYWRIFLRASEVGQGESDQVVLQAIDECNQGNAEALVTAIVYSADPHPAEHFFKRLAPEKLPCLLESVINATLLTSVDSWPLGLAREPRPPGIVSVWRMYLRNREIGRTWDSVAMVAAVDRGLTMSIPESLLLTQELLNLFLTRESKVGPLVDDETILATIKRAEASMLQNVGNPDRLAASLLGAYRDTLLSICRRFAQGDLSRFPFPGWHEFAKTVIEAAKKKPLVLVPQLLPFIIQETDEFTRRAEFVRKMSFNAQAAEFLFGTVGLAEALAAALLCLDDFSAEDASRVKFASQEIRSVLLAQIPGNVTGAPS